jgi:hypothetical protein
MTVTRDATSRIAMPMTASEWSECLTGTGLNAPSSYWRCSQAAGSSLADLGTGARTVTLSGSPSLGAAASGWSATGIKGTDGGAQTATFTIPTTSTTSSMLLQCWGLSGNQPAAARDLNWIGAFTGSNGRLIAGTTGVKLRSHSPTPNDADGTQNYSGILVTITKFDRANSVQGVYARGERLKATYGAPVGSTTGYLLGGSNGATDATLVYGAYWSGADAEISDSQIQLLINAVYGDATTLSAMQAGGFIMRWVACIEGCQYILHENLAEATTVLNAYAGTDWTQSLGGLVVDLKNKHQVTPWDPFTGGGSCQLRVIPDVADTFGVLVNKRAAGNETALGATCDRDDTSITVASTTGFAGSGEVFIGTECIGYTSTDATHFLGCTRGKYSPFGCSQSGSGGKRFANHHRLGNDQNHVQMQPVVTDQPRQWIGKRVGVWLHTWDPSSNTINPRNEAQLVFAGRIAGIADDPNTFATVIDLEPIHDEIRNGVIGKDMWAGELAEGITMVTGRTFTFGDGKSNAAYKTANSLTVVASGASGTNQINAGRYSLQGVCEFLSAWLAGEKNAGRIYGQYSVASPVTSNVGLRTKMYWRIEDATSTTTCLWAMSLPGEVSAFLGITKTEPGSTGVTEGWGKNGMRVNTNYIAQGDAVPFTNLVFKPSGPGRLGQEFTEVMTYLANNERGTFTDQYAYLPANIKSACASGNNWGLFLLNDQVLMVGSYSAGTLTKCWLAPFQLTADKDSGSNAYIGRRADEAEGGAITLRQVFVFEKTLAEMFQTFVYGSGTSGYNHSTWDVLGYGLGIGIPGELLGGEFERSLTNMPQTNAPIAVVIDEPTKFVDLFSADLVLRRSFLRWKDEGFQFAQWQTPRTALAVAALPESTKAAPVGHDENHRVSSAETQEHARPIIKFDYCRDFAVGRDGQYLKSIQLEDQTAVDDLGGNVKPFTLQLRNTYHDLGNMGSPVEALIPEFLAYMPVLARPFRMITRSIDLRFFEGYSVGDIVTVTDSFARDPLTGRRGITSRAAMISRLSYDLGGKDRPMGGEVDLFFLDTHRGDLYCPSAQVDDTATNAGYNVGTKVLTCYAQKFTHTITIKKTWGSVTRTFDITEPADATWLAVGDRVMVHQIDVVSGGLTWDDTVAAQSGNTITLTTGLGGWDNTKKYRITYQKLSQLVSATQMDHVFQADSVDKLIENLEVAFHYSATEELYGYTAASFL